MQGTPLSLQYPKSTIMNNCPVSGLPVTEKDHWSFENRQGNYIRKYALIGADILHVQEIATHPVIPEQLYTADFRSLITEENLDGKQLYLLMDCSPISGLSHSYKKEFTSLLLDQESPFALIVLYNISPGVRLQFEMLQALEGAVRPVMLAESYNKAVTSILEFKSGAGGLIPEYDPQSLQEAALKQEFLAEAAAMLLRNQFSRELFFPPENHPARPYFDILDLIRQEMKALEEGHRQTAERFEQEFRTLLASKNSMLDAQAELNKKNEEKFKDEKANLLSRIASLELETTRVATASAEKNAALRSVCEMLGTLELDPSAKEQLSNFCTPMFENTSTASLVNTELTETDSAFISKLHKRHPDLNQRELRICLLIKLDYHSRDISRTLGLSTRGIESIRYRLHKKIGLDKHRSLKMYLTDLATESA